MIPARQMATPTTAMTILIADDHWVVRESLKLVARSLSESFETEEAASFDEALAVLDRNPNVGLLLVDLIMPGFREFEGLKLLRSRYPHIPVVIVSVHEDPDYVLRAIQHGVIGYIPKSANADEIKRALTRVISGEVTFPRDIIARAVPAAGIFETAPQAEPSEPPAPVGADRRIASLTHREREILAHLGLGRSLSEIADLLGISRQTVRVHLGNAMRKLAIETRESAIRFSVEHADALRLSLDGD